MSYLSHKSDFEDTLVEANHRFYVWRRTPSILRSPLGEAVGDLTVDDTLFYDGMTFSPGSVVSSALGRRSDPVKALERAMKHNHNLIWINTDPIVFTSHARKAENVIEVADGMLVRFEGVVARLKVAGDEMSFDETRLDPEIGLLKKEGVN